MIFKLPYAIIITIIWLLLLIIMTYYAYEILEYNWTGSIALTTFLLLITYNFWFPLSLERATPEFFIYLSVQVFSIILIIYLYFYLILQTTRKDICQNINKNDLINNY
jgi:TRAP-type C4-dicarboxylate transport system permease small subunit